MSAAGDRESAGRTGAVGDRPDAARQGGWFSRVGNAVLDDETLTAYQKSIYAALCRFADRDGRCHPSLATIAAKAGCARRSVVEGLRVLEERGYVVREPRKAGRCRISNLYRLYGNEGAPEIDPVNVNATKGTTESKDVITVADAGEDGTFCAPATCAGAASGGGVLSGTGPGAAETSSSGAVRSGVSCGAAGGAEAAAKTGTPRFAAFSSPPPPLRCPGSGGVRVLPRVVRDAPSPGQDAPDVVRQVPHSGREAPRPGQVPPSGSAPPASRTRLSEPDPETRRGNQRERPRPGRGEEAFASWVAGVVDRTLGAGGTRK